MIHWIKLIAQQFSYSKMPEFKERDSYNDDDDSKVFKPAENFDTAIYEEQALGESRLMAKMKKEPFVPIGVLAAIGTIGYAGVTFKNRGGMSTSIYLMHLRVRAQSMIVGAMMFGMIYQVSKKVWDNRKIEKT